MMLSFFVSMLILVSFLLMYKISFLSGRIDTLEKRIDVLLLKIIEIKAVPADKKTEVPQKEEETASSLPSKPLPWAESKPENIEKPQDEKVNNKEKTTVSGEGAFAFLGQNLNVWLAAGAGVLGAFFFVKYSIENALIGPAARLFLSVLFGVGAIVGGNIVFSKKDFANGDRIAQVLIGVGLSALYFVSYALSQVYGFVAPFVSFVLMCFVTAWAVFLSYKYQKTPLAVLTVIGGFLTPALVPQATGDAYFFSAYSVVCAVTFLMIAKKLNSPVLGMLILGALYVWVFTQVSFNFHRFDSILFFCVAATVFFATTFLFSGNTQKTAVLSKFAGAAAILLMYTLLVKAKYGMLEWGLTGLMCLPLLVKSVRNPEKYLPLLGGMLIVVFLLMGTWMPFDETNKHIVYWCFAAIAFVVPYLRIRRDSFFADFVAVVLPLLFAAHYLNFKNTDTLIWFGGIGAVLAVLPLLKTNFTDKGQSDDASKLILSAAALLTGSVFCMKIDQLLAVFLVLEAGILELIYQKTGIRRLHVGAWGTVVLFVMSRWAIVVVFGVELIGGQLFPNQFFAIWGHVKNGFLFYDILLPALSCLVLWKTAASVKMKNFALSAAAFLAADLLYCLLIRENRSAIPVFTDKAILTAGIFITYFIAQRQSALKFAKAFLFLGMWRFGVIGLLLQNPLWSNEEMSFAGMLLVYGLPTVILAAVALKKERESRLWVNGVAFLCFVLVSFVTTFMLFGTLQLRYIHATQAAVFVYSAVWLVLGIAELFLSLKMPVLTKPAFVLVYLVVGKVFLYDVSSLQGLWRVACLLGLAAALLGIGHCYAKYFKKQERA